MSTTTERESPLNAEREADSSDADVTPLRFVVCEHDDGRPTLGVNEAEIEHVYRLREPYSCALFVALCHREGVKAYRRARQHEGTVCVRTTLSQHDALWARFVGLTRKLDEQLARVAQQFIEAEVDGVDS